MRSLKAQKDPGATLPGSFLLGRIADVGDEEECEIARSRGLPVTGGDGSGPAGRQPGSAVRYTSDTDAGADVDGSADHSADTGVDGGAVPPPALRTVLRAADGVPIEAAYDRHTGFGAAGSGDATGAFAPARTPPAGAPGGDRDGGGADPCPGVIVLAHGFAGCVDRPAVRRAARAFARHAAVVTFSFRGHGGSGGHSTVGDEEVLDLAAAVRWARSLGHRHVTTVGFSMGGSVVVRHGALYRPGARDDDGDGSDGDHTAQSSAGEAHRGRTVASRTSPAPGTLAVDATGAVSATDAADAVVAVSAPARWYYRGTAPMRRLHWVVQRPLGRLVSRYGLRTRVRPRGWDPEPLPPIGAAPALAPTPLLVVHGDRDRYFPLDHPRSLAAAADPAYTDLWIVPGFGHAENAAGPSLLHRIGAWSDARCRAAAAARHHGTHTTDGSRP